MVHLRATKDTIQSGDQHETNFNKIVNKKPKMATRQEQGKGKTKRLPRMSMVKAHPRRENLRRMGETRIN